MTRGCAFRAVVARGEVCSFTGVIGWVKDTAAAGTAAVRPGIRNPPYKKNKMYLTWGMFCFNNPKDPIFD